jgi:hypothetical protein
VADLKLTAAQKLAAACFSQKQNRIPPGTIDKPSTLDLPLEWASGK